MHTLYLGAAPEYGKANFLERLEREVYRIKLQYPNATYVGIADGARVNWDFLERHTQYQVLDFFHATEYLAEASHAMHPIDTSARKIWLELACHRLKHEPQAPCKTLIKQRLCQSGMMWKNQGISMVLHLRALISTKGRWEQFWERINQAGLTGLAEIC